MARAFSLELHEEVKSLAGVKYAQRRPGARKKNKPIAWGETGHFARRDPNRPGIVYKEQSADYFEDRYREKVIDHATGVVEVDRDERLSEHQGYGSAKKGRRDTKRQSDE